MSFTLEKAGCSVTTLIAPVYPNTFTIKFFTALALSLRNLAFPCLLPDLSADAKTETLKL